MYTRYEHSMSDCTLPARPADCQDTLVCLKVSRLGISRDLEGACLNERSCPSEAQEWREREKRRFSLCQAHPTLFGSSRSSS